MSERERLETAWRVRDEAVWLFRSFLYGIHGKDAREKVDEVAGVFREHLDIAIGALIAAERGDSGGADA